MPSLVVDPGCKREPDVGVRVQGTDLETGTLEGGKSLTRCLPQQASRGPGTWTSTSPMCPPHLILEGFAHCAGHQYSLHSLLKSLPQIPVSSPGLPKPCGHPRQADHWSLFKPVHSRCCSLFVQWAQEDIDFLLMKCFSLLFKIRAILDALNLTSRFNFWGAGFHVHHL